LHGKNKELQMRESTCRSLKPRYRNMLMQGRRVKKKRGKENITSCGSFVRASTKSSEPDAQAAKCKGVIPPGPPMFGGKIYVLEELSPPIIE
jgi:hypothetical protein